MPGLVYTFERNTKAKGLDSTRRTSTDAIIAIATAAMGQRDIRYEELTESNHQAPLISVVFPDVPSMEAFNARIERELDLRGIKVRKIHMIEGSRTPEPPPLAAESEA